MGVIVDEAIVAAEGVVDSDAVVLDAEVTTMDATLRTVHTTTLCTITIVQDLCGQTSQFCAFLGVEGERGNTRAVLSEIHHQRLTWLQGDGLT